MDKTALPSSQEAGSLERQVQSFLKLILTSLPVSGVPLKTRVNLPPVPAAGKREEREQQERLVA